jgi:hypothetical protein
VAPPRGAPYSSPEGRGIKPWLEGMIAAGGVGAGQRQEGDVLCRSPDYADGVLEDVHHVVGGCRRRAGPRRRPAPAAGGPGYPSRSARRSSRTTVRWTPWCSRTWLWAAARCPGGWPPSAWARGRRWSWGKNTAAWCDRAASSTRNGPPVLRSQARRGSPEEEVPRRGPRVWSFGRAMCRRTTKPREDYCSGGEVRPAGW